MMTAEHRAASSSRHQAEDELERLGWTCANLPRPKDEGIQFLLMMKWCEENIGTGRVEIEKNRIDSADLWYSFSWYGYWNFWFRRAEDATMFTMRWA